MVLKISNKLFDDEVSPLPKRQIPSYHSLLLFLWLLTRVNENGLYATWRKGIKIRVNESVILSPVTQCHHDTFSSVSYVIGTMSLQGVKDRLTRAIFCHETFSLASLCDRNRSLQRVKRCPIHWHAPLFTVVTRWIVLGLHYAISSTKKKENLHHAYMTSQHSLRFSCNKLKA